MLLLIQCADRNGISKQRSSGIKLPPIKDKLISVWANLCLEILDIFCSGFGKGVPETVTG